MPNLQHPRIALAAVVVALGAAGAGVGVATASGGGSPASAPSVSASAPAPDGNATISTATATVNGRSETILVDGQGEPLYTFKGDTTTTSKVSGQLAALWPPLVASGQPTTNGAAGALTVVKTDNGRQIAYNGAFLYTFVDDSPGHVTGQGVQDFFIATPDTSLGRSVTPSPAASSSAGGYGY